MVGHAPFRVLTQERLIPRTDATLCSREAVLVAVPEVELRLRDRWTHRSAAGNQIVNTPELGVAPIVRTWIAVVAVDRADGYACVDLEFCGTLRRSAVMPPVNT